MTKTICIVFSILSSIFLFEGCVNTKQQEPLHIFSAASLTEVMGAMEESFEKETKTRVVFNFASSGTLARQIQLGAPAELFLSANKDWMDYLIKEEVLSSSNVNEVVGNTLVLIANKQYQTEDLSLETAIKDRFVMGDPKTVPVGNYAKQALTNFNLWDDNNDFFYGRDVKHVLKLVEMGEAKSGIVYLTDAHRSKNVNVLMELPDSTYTPIKYYIGTLNNESKALQSFIQFINSDKGKAIWQEYGFKTLD